MSTAAAIAAQLRGIVARGKVEAMTRAVLAVEAQVKRETPVRTGNLRRSITHRVEQGGNRGVIGTNASYARAVHEGRGPVVARRGHVLAFTIGGKKIFRRRVGPAKGNPFLVRGLEAARGDVERELAAWGNRWLGSVK
jgi:hypothetical protein